MRVTTRATEFRGTLVSLFVISFNYVYDTGCREFRVMPARYFSIDEVNELLPKISPLLGELLERRAKVASQRDEMTSIVSDSCSNVGGAVASAVVQEFMRIEQLVEKIHAFGCQIKDLNGGTIDFLTTLNGREVYLCWRYGEPLELAHYHALETGFMGRRPIDDDDDFWRDD